MKKNNSPVRLEQSTINPTYKQLILTLNTSCPQILKYFDGAVSDFIADWQIEFLDNWNAKNIQDVELGFYDLSDLFKERLGLDWDTYSVRINGDYINPETKSDNEFLLEALLRSLLNSYGFREYRSLAFYFLDRLKEDLDYEIQNQRSSFTHTESFINKLNLLYSFGKKSTAQYNPLDSE